MPDRELATAADYADAMLTARRAKNGLILLLILLLLGQLTVFFLVRFDVLNITSIATTQPAATTQAVLTDWGPKLHYFSGLFLFLGISTAIVLSFIILLIVNIMLVGRLIGVARVTSAYIWCIILLVLLFPWQAFLINHNLPAADNAFKLPGIFWTWNEFVDVTNGVLFKNDDPLFAVLKWARYVGMPIIALGMLLVIQGKTNRGMRQALGEDEDYVSSPPAE